MSHDHTKLREVEALIEGNVHDGFDLGDDEELNDTLDNENDARSITMAMPHSLEKADEDVAFYIFR
jgi:hypothetical protein